MSERQYIRVSNFSDCLAICLAPNTLSNGEQENLPFRWLGLRFDARDKEALFFRALKVFDPAGAVGGQIPVEDFQRGKWNELLDQFERSVAQATANLPMLRRFKEEYEGAFFSSSEVGSLREECETVRRSTDDPQALSALEKLIKSCDEALKENSALFFDSD